MKIRNGFVSNSSSSSYIIKIFDTYENFINNINKEIIYSNYFTKTIENCKNIIDKYNEIGQTSTHDKLSSWLYNSNSHIIELYNNYKKTNNIIEFIKNVYQIYIKEHNDYIEIIGGNSMNNSYDDVPDFIKHIVMLYICEYPSIKIDMEKIDE